MAYDTELADRVRELLAAEPGLTEKRMFGGLGFMLDGHMAVAANRSGGLLLRIDPVQREEWIADPRTAPMQMRGREMAGWLEVNVDASVSDTELARWVAIGVAYVRTLPPK